MILNLIRIIYTMNEGVGNYSIMSTVTYNSHDVLATCLQDTIIIQYSLVYYLKLEYCENELRNSSIKSWMNWYCSCIQRRKLCMYIVLNNWRYKYFFCTCI